MTGNNKNIHTNLMYMFQKYNTNTNQCAIIIYEHTMLHKIILMKVNT